jgi:competence protein ComEC
VLGAVIAGILAGQAEGAGRAGAAVLVAPLGIATAALARRRAARVVVAVLAFGLLGAAVTQRALHGLVRSPLAHPVAELADVSLRGTLVEDPAESRWETRVLVRARAFREIHGGWRDAGGRRVLVEGSGDAAVPLRVLEAGDGVTLDGWLGPLEGFDAQDRWRHAVGVLHTSALVALRDPTSPLQRVAEDARGLVLAGAGRLAPVDRALLGGFLVGDTRGLPDALVEQFRDAGLTHLLVVSGENVAFVLALFAPLLRRLGLRGRLVGGLAVLVLFGTMTRWERRSSAPSRWPPSRSWPASSAGPPKDCARWCSRRRCSCSRIRSSSTRWASACRAAPASGSRSSPGRWRGGSPGPRSCATRSR